MYHFWYYLKFFTWSRLRFSAVRVKLYYIIYYYIIYYLSIIVHVTLPFLKRVVTFSYRVVTFKVTIRYLSKLLKVYGTLPFGLF